MTHTRYLQKLQRRRGSECGKMKAQNVILTILYHLSALKLYFEKKRNSYVMLEFRTSECWSMTLLKDDSHRTSILLLWTGKCNSGTFVITP